MKTGAEGIALIKKWEQCRLAAYQDSGGVWTIGWGHTGPEVVRGLCWSQAKADQVLLEDLSAEEACVSFHVTVPLTQNEFNALVSLIHNIGCGAFTSSHLLRYLNDSNYDAASAEVPKWDHDNGKEIPGLKHRRLEEQSLFETTGSSSV